MKFILPILAISASLLLAANPAAGIKSVYVMPMAHGIDQFIANRITNEQVLRVVTDPKLADAVLTDRIGDALTRQLEEIAPEREKPKAKPADGQAAAQLETPVVRSAFNTGKGNFFLVDTDTKEVLWSTFENPKDATPKSLDRSAGHIVDRLKRTRK